MKLVSKLVAFLLAGIVVLLLVDVYLSVEQHSRHYRADMQQDACLLGDAIQGLVEDVWRTRGKEQALRLIDQANQHEHLVRIRWLQEPQYDPVRQETGNASTPTNIPISLVARGDDGEARMLTYVPVSVSDPTMGFLELSEPMSLLAEYNRTIVYRTVLLAAGVFAVCGAGILLLGVWLVGQPLHRLAKKARQVGAGDLSGRLEMARRDEMGELASAMNEMCHQLSETQSRLRLEEQRRIETLEQLRHADRLRTVGTLAAGVAHELGTPLNTISIRSGLIAQESDANSSNQRNASIIRVQAERMTKIVQQLLSYARPRSLQRTETDLNIIAQRTLEFLKPLAKSHNIEYVFTSDACPAITAVDVDQVQQALTNLIVNAVQAMPAGGHIHLSLEKKHADPPAGQAAKPGEYYCVTVRDEGEGIPAKNLKHVFDPFFTTKDIGVGTGLGLSNVLGIVQEHGGWIDVSSAPGHGSCFSLHLPITPAPNSTDENAGNLQAQQAAC